MATPERPDRLYRLLGVTDQSLPAEEICRLYRSTEGRLRQQYLAAYRILSNPESKRLYDIFGERIVEFLEHPAWAQVVTTLGSTGTAWTYAVGLVLTVMLTSLFFIFLALRVDGTLTFSWVSTFSPLYVILIVAIVATIVFLVMALWHPTVRSIVGTVVNLIYVSMLFVCLNLSATQLDRPRGNRWVLIFITLMIADLVRNAEWVWWRYPSKVRKAMVPPVAVEPPAAQPPIGARLTLLSLSFVSITVVDTLVAMLGWIILGLRIDGDISWPWYYIAIPFVVRLGLMLLWSLCYFEYARTVGQETGFVEVVVLVRLLFFVGVAVTTIFLVAFFLEGGETRFTLAFAFIPVYVGWCLMFVCALVTAFFWILRNQQMIELECEEIRRHAKLPWSERSHHEPLDSFMGSPRKAAGLSPRIDASGVPFGSVGARDPVESVAMSMQQQRVAHVFNLSDSEVSEDTEVEPVDRFTREAAPSESQLSDLSVYRRGYP